MEKTWAVGENDANIQRGAEMTEGRKARVLTVSSP